MIEEDQPTFLTAEQLIESLPFTVNNYEFQQLIGRGGFSVVFKIFSYKTKSFFAAKAINTNPQNDPKGHFKHTAESEINSLKQLNHPNIIKLYDYFEHQGFLILVLQYCPNGCLKKIIPKIEGLSTNNLNFYLNQIISAIAFAHSKHIAHRDIKPENIFLDEFNRPVLADFGLSGKFTESQPVQEQSTKLSQERRYKNGFLHPPPTSSQIICNHFDGTQIYEAPEMQLYCSHDPFKADMWSLGVTFYYMTTGMLPWDMTNKVTLQKSILNAEYFIPKSVDLKVREIIKFLIRIEPEDRPTASMLFAISNEQYSMPRSQSWNFKPSKLSRSQSFLGDSSHSDTQNSTSDDKISPRSNVEISNTFKSALTSNHFGRLKKKKILPPKLPTKC